MRYGEQHPARRPSGHESACPPDLVLIGHVGLATDRLENGTVTYTGGSGFATAFAAGALLDGVGLVAQVGEDFDLDILRLLSIEMDGIAVLPGTSAKLFIDKSSDGSLSFSSDLGVAAVPNFDLFPASYLRARYIHLGTAPPRQQLAWLEFLRAMGCRAQISVDMFEPFVKEESDICHETCGRADLIFLNEIEYRSLYNERSRLPAPTILKLGAGGAEFLAEGAWYPIQSPPVDEVDPVGAGEILAGSFLALRARGLAVDRALAFAVAVAARSVTEFGVTGPAVTSELQRVREELSPGESVMLLRTAPDTPPAAAPTA
jgi:sugar/nucleoside kinase (ribokinase family)